MGLSDSPPTLEASHEQVSSLASHSGDSFEHSHTPHAQPVAYNAIHPSRLKSLPTPQPDHPDAEKLKAPGFDLPPPAFGDPMIYPSTEEFATLRKVPGKIFLNTYLIAFVEFAERFSYYGTTVVFTNFIQRPLPPGSTTGAGGLQAGALGLGQQAATGITTFNSFWVYLCPLFGAYVADAHLGRYNTIIISIFIALIGHTLLVISAIPTVIVHPSGSTACFLVAIIIMGIGTGGFKPNISPLVAEQADTNNQKPYIKVLPKTNEKVIVDPTLTAGRIYMYFYLMINVGALTGQIGMVYAEKYVGFWLAYLLPTVLFCTCPLVMILGKPLYVLRPPTGSVFGKALKLMKFATIKKFQASRKSPQQPIGFWEAVKPSNLAGQKPTWMNFDDQWVDEIRRGVKACRVFLWFPLYWLTYNQMNNNLTSQAAVMDTQGLPNDIISNLDPFALIILIPICDLLIYPALRRAGINFSPIKRITAGFITGALAMGWAAIIQHWIYQRSTCGNMAGSTSCPPVDINVWVQTPSYILIAFSEILASVTGLEYAFTLAPKNMRSLVTALFLFQSAIASALGEAFVPLSADPLLVWNYGTMGVIAFVAGIAFHFFHRSIDREHEYLIRLQEGTVPDGKNVLDPKDAENNQIIIHNSDNHHQDQHDEHDHDHDHEPNLVMGEHEASKHS
ncbi:hypothetical protein Pst134EA_011737 [Puccinia striiformis f. sp. tritici]|uniref:hypothetical protein n=1 Tax=Puccinia striiformis f. sp. tritici TaxID=168172 RepID=UPI0020081C71|nr:hypothetical protein Pst134EA_011737 [Puccinia striiformis f. sp. tritici]KAH9468116.1 hypothetical protein Pst134EA_011737 [Puccinia striiformis f. sp. tritici]